MTSDADTVDDYLRELPPDRRAAIEAVRKVILKSLDKGFEEGMQYGMIGYYVPHRLFPAGYHCDPKQPLGFVCLGSQKNYMSVYLGPIYGDTKLRTWFEQAWAKAGKKLDAGKCCVRFKRVEDLALDVLGEAIRRVPLKAYLAAYEASRAEQPARPKAVRRNAVHKKAVKKTPARRGSKS